MGVCQQRQQWLTFVDSDDWVHEEYLERLYQAAVDNNVGMSVCDYATSYGEQLIIDKQQAVPIVLTPEAYYVSNRATGIDSPWGKLYRKTLFNDIRYPVGKIYEDSMVTHKLVFRCEQIAWCKVPLYAYFRVGASITRSKWTPRQMDLIEAFREQADFFIDKGFYDAAWRGAKRNFWAIAYQYVCVSKSDYPKAEKRHYHKVIRKELKERISRFHRDLNMSYISALTYAAGCFFTEKWPKSYEKINRLRRK